MPSDDCVDPSEVERVLDAIRPALRLDRGGVQLVEVVGRDARVELLGSCSTCRSRGFTLRYGIESELRRRIPGFGRVVTIDNNEQEE